MLRTVRKTARGVLSSLGLKQRRSDLSRYAEATAEEQELVALYSRYSMTSPLRMWTLLKAVKYADQIDGDIVECGVWRGGNMMLAKAVSNKRIWLYDTFAGMSEPTDHDVGRDGRIASPSTQPAKNKITTPGATPRLRRFGPTSRDTDCSTTT